MAKPSAAVHTLPYIRTGKTTGRVLTSEQIDSHMKAFRKAGGTVEKLGNTQTFKHIGPGGSIPKK